MVIIFSLLAAFAVAWFLAYHRMRAVVWTGVFGALLWGYGHFAVWPPGLITGGWILLIVVALLTIPSPLRRQLIGARFLAIFRRILPPVSQTEREALEAGTVWWDGDIFSGNPDWNKLLAYPK